MALPSREFVIAEVDREFLLQHPDSPRQLNPDDPAQAHWVSQWDAMFHEFLSRTVDSHFFRFYPNSPHPLNPDDPEHAQLIVFWNDLREAILTGAGRYDWSSPPHAAADGAAPTGDGAGPAHQSTAAAPEAGVHPDESQVKEAVHLWLEGAHYIGDTSEVLGYLASAAGAGEESAVVLLGEALGPVGMIASVILVGWETIHAFGTGLRLQEQQGFCYGVMWQVCGLSNQHKNFIDWAGDTAGELKEAFYAGVSDGRAKAGDAATHNRVMLVIAYYQASSGDLDWARHRVLNDLWQHVRENNLGRDDLAWPVPESMQL